MPTLDASRKAHFLTFLAVSLADVGRSSYDVNSTGLTNPEQLRQINELIRPVLACLRGVLAGTNSAEFESSVGRRILDQADAEFLELVQWAWFSSKELLKNVGHSAQLV